MSGNDETLTGVCEICKEKAVKELDRAHDEIKRLRAGLERIAATPCTHRTCNEYCQEICLLIREILIDQSSFVD